MDSTVAPPARSRQREASRLQRQQSVRRAACRSFCQRFTHQRARVEQPLQRKAAEQDVDLEQEACDRQGASQRSASQVATVKHGQGQREAPPSQLSSEQPRTRLADLSHAHPDHRVDSRGRLADRAVEQPGGGEHESLLERRTHGASGAPWCAGENAKLWPRSGRCAATAARRCPRRPRVRERRGAGRVPPDRERRAMRYRERAEADLVADQDGVERHPCQALPELVDARLDRCSGDRRPQVGQPERRQSTTTTSVSSILSSGSDSSRGTRWCGKRARAPAGGEPRAVHLLISHLGRGYEHAARPSAGRARANALLPERTPPPTKRCVLRGHRCAVYSRPSQSRRARPDRRPRTARWRRRTHRPSAPRAGAESAPPEQSAASPARAPCSAGRPSQASIAASATPPSKT